MEKFVSKPDETVDDVEDTYHDNETEGVRRSDRDYSYDEQRAERSSHHKTMSRSLSSGSQFKISGFNLRENMKVDLSKLEMPALLRYWRHYNLVHAIPNPSKEQLIDIVKRHFMSQEVDELEVIAGFVQAARRMKKA